MWRVFGTFKQNAVYIDIETTGFYKEINEITVIGANDNLKPLMEMAYGEIKRRAAIPSKASPGGQKQRSHRI